MIPLKISAWADVKRKGKRLLDSDYVYVEHYDAYYIMAIVGGDHEIYSTSITRKNAFGKRITHYECSCPWGYWAYRREYKYVGRLCSHALALFYRMQSMDYAIQRDKDLQLVSTYSSKRDLARDKSSDLMSFIDWLNESDVDPEKVSHSQIVGLAEMYAEEHKLDLEDLIISFFTTYVYDEELDEQYGKGMTENVWTPDGVGEVVTSKVVDGEEYVRVANYDIGLDSWFHEDEIEPYEEKVSNTDSDLELTYAHNIIDKNIAALNAIGFNSSKTSGRVFTFEEQSELLDEDGIADQLEELDLNGTHYI